MVQMTSWRIVSVGTGEYYGHLTLNQLRDNQEITSHDYFAPHQQLYPSVEEARYRGGDAAAVREAKGAIGGAAHSAFVEPVIEASRI